MNNKASNIQKYSYLLAVSKVREDYERRGYDVKTEYPITPGFRADLYVTKNNEKIIVELKTTMPQLEYISNMRAMAAREEMDYVVLIYNCVLTINEV